MINLNIMTLYIYYILVVDLCDNEYAYTDHKNLPSSVISEVSSSSIISKPRKLDEEELQFHDGSNAENLLIK